VTDPRSGEPGHPGPRPTGMGRHHAPPLQVAVATVVLALGMLTGCANPSTVGPGGSGSGSGSGSGAPTGSPAPTTPSGTGGLRGEKAGTIECASTTWQPDEHAAQPLPSMPVRLVICPLPMPNAVHPPADLRPPPSDLLAALAEPDGPKPTASPYMCAAYADAPRLVYAQTAGGTVYLLHIPVDACGHYLMHALTAVNRYAMDGPVGQSTGGPLGQ
jgi:hypothetical protein